MEIGQKVEVHGNLVKDIFRSSAEQSNTFRREVEGSHGEIRILVHPFYDNAEDATKNMEASLRLIKSNSKDRLPLIIIEEKDQCERYEQESNPLVENAGIYLVPSHWGNPHPIEGWDVLISLFKKAGVKRMLIGGMYLTYQDEEEGMADYQIYLKRALESQDLKPPKTLGGCVGITAGILAKAGFDVHLSNISYPVQPSKFSK